MKTPSDAVAADWSAEAPAALPVARLRWTCDPALFSFTSTSELPELCEVFGQQRALEALRFGVEIEHAGYNVFVLGSPGIGKRTVVRQFLEQQAAHGAPPEDWCYLNDFSDPRRPKALAIPAGVGAKLRDDVKTLISELSTSIVGALESDDHKTKIQAVVRETSQRQERALQELGEHAKTLGVQLIRTPDGFMLAPLKDGEIISPDAFQQLSDDERQKIEKIIAEQQEALRQVVEQFPKWQKETHDRVDELNRDAVRLATGHLLSAIKQQYASLPQIVAYFDDVEHDILKRADEFRPAEESPLALLRGGPQPPSFDDYEINLLVDHKDTEGAPVIVEDHPTYQNLTGRVEHESEMGALTTNFRLIKAGALHRANGGFLVLDARALLSQPFAWESLERVLRAKAIKIESLAESLSLLSTVSLEPEPIPLRVKVVVVGDRWLYYLLYNSDPDFAELFKVAADFDERVPRSGENCERFACFLGSLARNEKTRPLAPSGVARALEHAARIAEDAERLSVHARALTDVVREADYWAAREQSEHIAAAHVSRAIDQQIYRSDRLRQLTQEQIARGAVMIDCSGERVGQVNGLSVLDLGNFRFGQPSRITATTRLGRGEVIDIEREVKLGGALHSKGVLIISSFLASRFAQHRPLSLAASLVFEQSYGMVDGDSASVAEICALMSALADLPIRQSLAVTGSVNQFGEVQAIGGVNEKIEGFFDVCQARGLTGQQGVLIPPANVPHLMLRQDVVAAATEGKFHIYAVETVDQALALLTGQPAGQRTEAGTFPAESVNGRVEARLQQLTELRMKFAQQASAPDHRTNDEQ